MKIEDAIGLYRAAPKPLVPAPVEGLRTERDGPRWSNCCTLTGLGERTTGFGVGSTMGIEASTGSRERGRMVAATRAQSAASSGLSERTAGTAFGNQN